MFDVWKPFNISAGGKVITNYNFLLVPNNLVLLYAVPLDHKQFQTKPQMKIMCLPFVNILNNSYPHEYHTMH